MDKTYLKFVDKNVRTVWVKTWTAEFLKGLDSLSSDEQIKPYCEQKKIQFEQECQRLSGVKPREEESSVGWKNSAATHMSQIRNAIKAWQQSKVLTPDNTYPQQTKDGVVQQHLALLVMNYPSGFHTERKAPTEAKKQEQRRNLESINRVDEYQSTIEKLLLSLDHRELVAGLIAATGRRPSEIYRTAEFKQIGQFEVMFTGQIKNKGEERQPYPTYTLVESSLVVDGLARLRRMPEIKELRKQTLAEIDSGKNSSMNSKVKEYFSLLVNPPMGEIELSSKNLRASYAAIAIYLFCPWNHSTNLFITERLGHTSDATATNYEDYQVTDKQGKPLTRGAWVNRIGEEMSKPMEATITQPRIRMTEAAKEIIENQEFLPFADQVSRIDELIRLARIGKQFEEGKLVKEVITVIDRPVEKHIDSTNKTVPASEDKNIVEKDKPSAKRKDFSEMSNAELFSNANKNLPNSGAEKIRRAIQAIKTYNERQYNTSTMWAINIKVLKDLTNCRTAVIDNYLNSDEGRLNVADYNLEKGFSYQHNRGKGNIADFVKLYIEESKVAPQSEAEAITQVTPKVEPEVEPEVTKQPTPVTTKETNKQQNSVKPKATSAKKVITLPHMASTIDIHDTLRTNPDHKVKTKGGYTYVLTNNNAEVLTEETGQVEKLLQ